MQEESKTQTITITKETLEEKAKFYILKLEKESVSKKAMKEVFKKTHELLKQIIIAKGDKIIEIALKAQDPDNMAAYLISKLLLNELTKFVNAIQAEMDPIDLEESNTFLRMLDQSREDEQNPQKKTSWLTTLSEKGLKTLKYLQFN